MSHAGAGSARSPKLKKRFDFFRRAKRPRILIEAAASLMAIFLKLLATSARLLCRLYFICFIRRQLSFPRFDENGFLLITSQGVESKTATLLLSSLP